MAQPAPVRLPTPTSLFAPTPASPIGSPAGGLGILRPRTPVSARAPPALHEFGERELELLAERPVSRCGWIDPSEVPYDSPARGVLWGPCDAAQFFVQRAEVYRQQRALPNPPPDERIERLVFDTLLPETVSGAIALRAFVRHTGFPSRAMQPPYPEIARITNV